MKLLEIFRAHAVLVIGASLIFNGVGALASDSGALRFNDGIHTLSNFRGTGGCTHLGFEPFHPVDDRKELVTNWAHKSDGPSGEIRIEIADGIISGSMSSSAFNFPSKAEIETHSNDLHLKFDVHHEAGQCWLSFRLVDVVAKEGDLSQLELAITPDPATSTKANVKFANPPQFLADANRTLVEFEECFAVVHGEEFRLEGRIFANWARVVEQSGGVNDDSVATPLVWKCTPFLSGDYLTWTAPLPAELTEQSEEASQVATILEPTKTIDPPEPQSSEVVESQPTEADKNIELEFWQSIKDSNDSDMFREYLRQFPSGIYAGLATIKIKKLRGSATSVAEASIPNLDYGDYYALVIGNNEYQDLTNLRSAVNDAKVISTVLEVDYGFNVKLLENASRKDILRSLKHLRQSVGAKDNVLIYYAGHGYLDKAADQGYWLPVDSERDDDSNWIPTDRITGQIKAMQAKHVMVVADSCFSGTITRAIKIEQRTPEWLSEIVKKKARTALTSGGLEPVLDTGSGNHSAFAYAFISLLEENDGVLDASQLFSKLRPKVMVNSTQTPQYGKIHMAGDDGGDFLFVRR
jgi:hypothetical protein